MKKSFLKLHIVQEKNPKCFYILFEYRIKQEVYIEGKIIFLLIIFYCNLCKYAVEVGVQRWMTASAVFGR